MGVDGVKLNVLKSWHHRQTAVWRHNPTGTAVTRRIVRVSDLLLLLRMVCTARSNRRLICGDELRKLIGASASSAEHCRTGAHLEEERESRHNHDWGGKPGDMLETTEQRSVQEG